MRSQLYKKLSYFTVLTFSVMFLSGCSLAMLTKGFGNEEAQDSIQWHEPSPVNTQHVNTTNHNLPNKTFGTVKGMNLETYLSSGEGHIEDRISRLETAIVALTHDLNTSRQAMTTHHRANAMTTENSHAQQPQIQHISDDFNQVLETMTQPQHTQQAQKAMNAPQALTHTNTTNKPGRGTAQQSAVAVPEQKRLRDTMSVPAQIFDLRTGEHKDKTRIVIDSSGPITYSYDLDNMENLLVITFEGAEWATKYNDTFRKSKLLGTYTVAGNSVIFQLNKNAKVTQTLNLEPGTESKSYRTVFDLTSM